MSTGTSGDDVGSGADHENAEAGRLIPPRPEMPAPPTAQEWCEAAWAIQSWIRSCFDLVGVCTLCGAPDAQVHVNDCPWPGMRALLDRSQRGYM